jgi:maleate isomerase
MHPDRERPEAWRGRVGLIIPSSNRLSEAQLARYAPPGVQFHTTRLRMTGPHHATPSQMMDRIRAAAATLADAKVNLIVFHCTGSSMEEGPGADEAIAAAIRDETGVAATTTATAVVAALRALALQRLVLVTPYPAETTRDEVGFLEGLGFQVAAAHALDLGGSDSYISYSPDAWYDAVVARRDATADGYFVSCTNIRATEVLQELEAALGKPVVGSNQATLWYVLRHLGIAEPVPGLGRLLATPAALPA